ncbi:MAG: LPS-assembly protein LptD [Alysiella sp.]|nr:LPS-assembly protein LptD [Alysiella sp.]MDO4434447.1 LPS-assembly protein LptD [Alysiella sp.]
MSHFSTPKPLVLILCLSFSGSLFATTNTWTQQGALCHALPENNQNLPTAQSSGGDKLHANATRITADRVAGQTQTQHHAEGNVIVERNNETLNANWINYTQTNDTIRAGDVFTLSRSENQTIRGENLNYQLNNGTGSAHNTEFEINDGTRRLQGISSHLEMQNQNQMTMHDVAFNTCNAGDKSWYIQAASLHADRETGIGVARHAKLVFSGIPILYTPWADFPINGNRKSGFLVPTLKIGSDGTQMDLPYYLNLAPNYDATITPSIISARGVRIGSEIRYLQPSFSGSLNTMYMPQDKRSRFNHRTEINLQHQHQFNNKWQGGIDYNQVSDDDYYRDFYGRNEIATNINLNRKLWLTYQNNMYGQPLHAEFMLQKYQTLSDAQGNKNKPYAMLPRLTAQWHKDFGNSSHFAINAQFTHFDHDSKQAGSRVFIYPSLQWHYQNNWAYLKPKIGIHATQYWLNAFSGSPSHRFSRVLPIANIESGLNFERQTTLFGKPYLQTLEPKLFYNYIPQKAQNHLPNFDSSENDFNYEQLFRENIYSGSDRINASNSLSIGLQTRYLNPNTGQERFRAGIGQKFYLNHDNVLLSGNISKQTRNRSDLTAFANGWLHPNWYTDLRWHWSENSKATQRFDAGIRYNPQAGKVVSLRYKYGRNEEIYSNFYSKLQHIDLAAQWPIKSNLYAVGRLNYSISPRRTLEQTAGLEYRNPCGCWSASFVAQRYAKDLNGYKNAFFLTLQLKDLSSIGNNPYEQLKLGIPGYTKTNEVFHK